MNEQFEAVDLIANPDRFKTLSPPAKLCIFGDPVQHSLSPQMQNAALKESGFNGQYVRIHATPEQFPDAIRALPKAGFLGANVTLPHKVAAAKLCDEIDENAEHIGAVNTILVEANRLLGFNTDGPGFARAIQREFSVDLKDLRVLLLGAGGGAGRSIAIQCARERCERLVLVNRTLEKAQLLAKELRPYFQSDRLQGPLERLQTISFDPGQLASELAQIDLIINATSIGMKRNDPPLIPHSLLTPNLLVYDTIYAPPVTRLLEDAQSAGARTANGLSMLLHQGALAFEIWFNRPAPLAIMASALESTAR